MGLETRRHVSFSFVIFFFSTNTFFKTMPRHKLHNNEEWGPRRVSGPHCKFFFIFFFIVLTIDRLQLRDKPHLDTSLGRHVIATPPLYDNTTRNHHKPHLDTSPGRHVIATPPTYDNERARDAFDPSRALASFISIFNVSPNDEGHRYVSFKCYFFVSLLIFSFK